MLRLIYGRLSNNIIIFYMSLETGYQTQSNKDTAVNEIGRCPVYACRPDLLFQQRRQILFTDQKGSKLIHMTYRIL